MPPWLVCQIAKKKKRKEEQMCERVKTVSDQASIHYLVLSDVIAHQIS